MCEFFIVLLLYASVGLMFIYNFRYLGGKNYEIALKAKGPASYWPESKKKRFVNVLRALCLVSGLFILSGAIPMIQDIPDLQNEKYEVIEGIPDDISHPAFGSWWFSQYVDINGKKAVFYFHSPLPTDRYYKIYCLKHSRYAVKVLIMPRPDSKGFKY